MRLRVLIILGALVAAVLVCAAIARRSKKPLAHEVFVMLISVIPPIVGNILIIQSGDWLVSRIGCYVYFIGLDFTVAAALLFSAEYCSLPYRDSAARKIIIGLVVIDVVQLLLNIPFGHAFDTAAIDVAGYLYYQLVPLGGQVFHRLVAYGLFFASVGLVAYKTITVPYIYKERFIVLLVVMVLTGAWESFYIFSGSPIDRSMIGFGVYGLLVFFFALYYKPVFLLDRMLARVVTNMNEAMLFFDREATCIFANKTATKLLRIGDSRNIDECSQVIGQIVGDADFFEKSYWSCTRKVTADLKPYDESTASKSSDLTAHDGISQYAEHGIMFWSISFRTLDDKNGNRVGSFLSIRDVTDDALRLRRESYNAAHDQLTGLYNATHLFKQARKLLERNPDTSYSVVGIDVKDFKLINDTFSRQYGDDVLIGIAKQMQSHLEGKALYGRISGDRFGFMIPTSEVDPDAYEALLSDAQFIQSSVNYPIVVHMGIYDITERDMPVSNMYDRALMAIDAIKNDYQRHTVRYDEAMRVAALWNQQISSELDSAIEQGQIIPYLQPVVNNEGSIEGAEMLVRWIHPEQGFLSPARFIPQFEENGNIAKLDAYIWECACKTLMRWEECGIDLFISVNISPKDFYFMDVYKTIDDLASKYRINPNKLRLEITETVVMSDLENRLHIIDELRSAGFLVEMDDFGSGYSSLNLLKDMPVDILKIDMMFLNETKDEERARTILQTIINLSYQLGMPSVTEGVETAEQFDMLVEMGCRMFQGFYFARPMSLDDFEKNYLTAA